MPASTASLHISRSTARQISGFQHCALTLDGAKAALPCETARHGKAERTALPAVDANQSVHFRLGPEPTVVASSLSVRFGDGRAARLPVRRSHSVSR